MTITILTKTSAKTQNIHNKLHVDLIKLDQDEQVKSSAVSQFITEQTIFLNRILLKHNMYFIKYNRKSIHWNLMLYMYI